MMRSRALNRLAAMALVTAGCAVQGSAGEKSGAAAEPITLRLGTVETASEAYGDEVQEFADAVDRLSDGGVKVEIAWEATGPFSGESEQELSAMVRKGEVDLAVVPTRVWDQIGVASMQALQAPFLVDSLALANEIARSELAEEMLGGLADVGVTGLAMWPESLRHPIGFAEPLVTVDDFRGAQLRVPPSDASYRLVRDIGAEPVDPAEWDVAYAAGELDGAESAFVWAAGLPAFGTFTANITFYPKVNTIVANQEVFESLTNEERDVLRRAATETLAYVVGSNPSEAELAADYCATGGAVVLADNGELAELTAMVESVFAALEANAQTQRLIDEIRTLKEHLSADPSDEPAACQHEAGGPAGDSAAVDEPFPQGVYRAELLLPSVFGNEPLVVTLTFEDGEWISHDDDAVCTGTYVTEIGRVRVTLDAGCGQPAGVLLFDARWTVDGDQLRFVDIQASDPNAVLIFGSEPWTKIE